MRHFVLLMLLCAHLFAVKLNRPNPQVPGRDYNIEYRIEWTWEKDSPRVVYEWFWMPDGEYQGR